MNKSKTSTVKTLLLTCGKPKRELDGQPKSELDGQPKSELDGQPKFQMAHKCLAILRKKIKSESGSAIVEFVALAIPLFIPVFIYLNHFSSVSVNEEIARSMAREVLRVYVISEDDFEARTLSSKASKLLARQWHLTDWELVTLELKLDCSHTPCLSANGRVKLTVRYTDEETGRVVSASAQEHLSPWL